MLVTNCYFLIFPTEVSNQSFKYFCLLKNICLETCARVQVGDSSPQTRDEVWHSDRVCSAVQGGVQHWGGDIHGGGVRDLHQAGLPALRCPQLWGGARPEEPDRGHQQHQGLWDREGDEETLCQAPNQLYMQQRQCEKKILKCILKLKIFNVLDQKKGQNHVSKVWQKQLQNSLQEVPRVRSSSGCCKYFLFVYFQSKLSEFSWTSL